jgi:glycosyltransferase involved in cell wall biosynthesis
MSRLNIVTISSVYPNPYEPTLGLFVEARQRALAEHHDVHVVVPVGVLDYSGQQRKFRGRQSFPNAARKDGLEVSYVKWVYPPWGTWINGVAMFARLVPYVKDLHRRQPIDILDAHFAFPDGVAASLLAKMLDIPYVVTLRGNEPMHCKKPFVRRTVSYALRHAAHVISVSDSLRAFALRQGATPDHATTVGNGVDTDLFYPRNREQLRRERSIGAHEPVIASVGYLIRRKGHDKVIRALADLRRAGLPARLLIAGGPGREDPCEKELHDLVSTLGLESAVSFLGSVPRDELPNVLSIANVLCLASSREGWPNVLNEALACGIPVVASDVGAARDIVSHEDLGCVVPVNEQKALTAALATLLTKRASPHTVATASQSRSWNTVGLEVATLVSAACKRGAGHVPARSLTDTI